MKRNYHIWVFVAVVVLIPITVFGIVKLVEQRYQSLPIYGDANHALLDFDLVDQHGKKVTLKSWENKIVVANFFFTHCTSVCPKMMYGLKRVQAYAGVERLQVASFTVDPERDSIERMRQYAEQQDLTGEWQLLTGDKIQLYRLARKSFLIEATDGDGGPQDFIHSDKLVLIDTQKRIRGFFDGTSETEVNQLIRDIQKLNKE